MSQSTEQSSRRLESMSQYDRVEFFVAARIDDPIRPAKVERILVDVPIHPVGVVCLS